MFKTRYRLFNSAFFKIRNNFVKNNNSENTSNYQLNVLTDRQKLFDL